MGKLRENHGKIMGKFSENHGEIMEAYAPGIDSGPSMAGIRAGNRVPDTLGTFYSRLTPRRVLCRHSHYIRFHETILRKS